MESQEYFAYIRVSTVKQGEHGVSFQEQRDPIARYADRNDLTVSAWFEEKVTAAKRGRPVFGLARISIGGLAGTIVESRQVFKTAILANAAAILAAHNHVSGAPRGA